MQSTALRYLSRSATASAAIAADDSFHHRQQQHYHPTPAAATQSSDYAAYDPDHGGASFSSSHSKPFVDRVKVLLASGAGGDGASIMGHLMNNEFAGPVGGNGGKGGDLFVVSSKKVQDLSHIQACGAQIVAEKGTVGFGDLSSGRKGRSLELVVPCGTQIVDVDTNKVVVDLDDTNMRVLLLEGGQGGKGNANFANSIIHSPREATRGLPGNTMLANIELKLIADCGLVGYPNAGKSSLLNAISTSRPKIANYPFTTLNPFVGHIHDLYGRTCTVADLPGLIEGAYENRGLGHQFLRHVERTTVIAFVIDMYSPFVPSDTSISSAMAAAASLEVASAAGLEVSSASLSGTHYEKSFQSFVERNPDKFESNASTNSSSSPSSSSSDNPFLLQTKVKMQEPWEVLETLQNELDFFLPGLSEKGFLIFANKMDMDKDSAGNCMKAKLAELRKRTHLPVFPVSARKGIEYGLHHPSAGLAKPLAELTQYVYAAKKAREESSMQSQQHLEEEMDGIFRGRNMSHFAPVDFSKWRAKMKSATGGFSGLGASGGSHQLSDVDSFAKNEPDNAVLKAADSNFAIDAELKDNPAELLSYRVSADSLISGSLPPLSEGQYPRKKKKAKKAAVAKRTDEDTNATQTTQTPDIAGGTNGHGIVDDLGKNPFGREITDDDADDPFGGEEDGDDFDDDDDEIAKLYNSSNDNDPLAEHRFLRDGGMRSQILRSGGGEDGGVNAVVASPLSLASGAFAVTEGDHLMDMRGVDIQTEVEGPVVPVEDLTLSNTRMLRHNNTTAATASMNENAVSALREKLRPDVERVVTAGDGSSGASSSSSLPMPKGFFLRRPPKKESSLPAGNSSAAMLNGGHNQQQSAKAHRTSSSSSINAAINAAEAAKASSSSSSSSSSTPLPSEEMMRLIRPLVGGGSGGGVGGSVAPEGKEGRKTDLKTAMLSGGDDANNDVDLPLTSTARLAGLGLSQRGAQHHRHRQQESGAADLLLRTRVLDANELSLVDQQLDDAVGQSGHGEAFDAYKLRPNRSSFHFYRDRSLRGQYWKRSRLPGEKLRDEKWN